jgi:hypothetical protein
VALIYKIVEQSESAENRLSLHLRGYSKDNILTGKLGRPCWFYEMNRNKELYVYAGNKVDFSLKEFLTARLKCPDMRSDTMYENLIKYCAISSFCMELNIVELRDIRTGINPWLLDNGLTHTNSFSEYIDGKFDCYLNYVSEFTGLSFHDTIWIIARDPLVVTMIKLAF